MGRRRDSVCAVAWGNALSRVGRKWSGRAVLWVNGKGMLIACEMRTTVVYKYRSKFLYATTVFDASVKVR